MPALTDLHLTGSSEPLSLSAIDAIGQCSRLQSLRLDHLYLKNASFLRLRATPSLRQLRRLGLWGALARGGGFSADDGRAALSALGQLESLRLDKVAGVDLLLPHLAHAPALRTLVVACKSDGSFALRFHGPSHPSRVVLGRLLAATPQLEVQLQIAASLDEWRQSNWYQLPSQAMGERELMDDQWRNLQRMAAEIDRVTIVDRAVGQ